jgi:hypothetical protein
VNMDPFRLTQPDQLPYIASLAQRIGRMELATTYRCFNAGNDNARVP